ncbi:putative membrane protein [Bacillus cereus ATCC 10876]|nr:putative membrane protein [Bacillus cereus ATCC 10876]SUY94186.1 Uncharacterised protein [Bacillus cereus]
MAEYILGAGVLWLGSIVIAYLLVSDMDIY